MAEDFWAALDSPKAGPSNFWGDLSQPDEANDYQSRRKKYIELMKADPTFRAKPVEERSKFLFPKEEEKPTPLKPWRGLGAISEESEAGRRILGEGVEEFAQPKSYLRTLTGVPLAKMAVGGAQTLFAPMTGAFSELVSRRLGNLARRLPVPDPETLGQQTEEMADVGGAPLIAKGMGALRGPLSKLLPTLEETVGKVKSAGNARLAASENVATEAQIKTAEKIKRMRDTAGERLARVQALAPDAQKGSIEAYRKGMEGIRTARTQAGERMTAATEGIESQLAGQQAGVGLEAAKAGAPIGPKRMKFEKRYADLEQAADQIPISPVNLNVKAYGLTREPGIPGTPTLPSERSSAAITRNLTEADPEEIGNSVRRMLTSGGEAKAPNYKEITKMVLGPATSENVTVKELLLARKRLREAERAAYKAEHKNLGRQWSELEDAITKDIKELAKTDKNAATVYRISKNLDKDYFKKKSADWYAEGVDQAFDPAKGIWDRKRFTKWWENHADSTNNDKSLRRLLGDRYDGTKGLVEDMQKATELNIEQAAKEAIRNVNRRYGQEIRGLGTAEKGQTGTLKAREGAISKAVEGAESFNVKRMERIRKLESGLDKHIQVAQTKDLKEIEAETRRAIEEITGKPAKNLGTMMGSFMVMGGVHSIAGAPVYGLLSGNWPAAGAAAAGGVVSIGGGIFTLMHSGTLTRFMNTAKGSSIIARLTRAAPGTAQAVAASHAAVRYAQELERTAEQVTAPGEGVDTRPSSEKPKIQGPGGMVSTERTIGIESGGKHYNIPTIIDGKQVSDDEAVRQWKAGTNKPVGIFSSQEEADREASARSERIGRELAPQRSTQGAKEALLRKYGIGDAPVTSSSLIPPVKPKKGPIKFELPAGDWEYPAEGGR